MQRTWRDWLTRSPFAHRGLHDLARDIPENTMPAFEAAVAAGYGIELDVQQLGDGTLVVFHDEDLRRAAGVDLALQDITRSRMVDLALFGTKLRAPLLTDVLRLIDGRVPLMLEIKHHGRDTRIARAVHDEVRGYHGALTIQSFNPFVLAWWRTRRPALPIGQLGGLLRSDALSRLERLASRTLATLAISRADFINYELWGLPSAWVERVRAWGDRPLLCWTVRSEDDRRKAEQLQINYVFENIRP
jgi:glycerophosphoryl diester phosphodiesterase